MEHYFALVRRQASGAEDCQAGSKSCPYYPGSNPNVLRHTSVTLAIQKGIYLAAIQKILGHDRLTTTAIYLNLTDTRIVDEYAQKW